MRSIRGVPAALSMCAFLLALLGSFLALSGHGKHILAHARASLRDATRCRPALRDAGC